MAEAYLDYDMKSVNSCIFDKKWKILKNEDKN
jgi:hypothetical protein